MRSNLPRYLESISLQSLHRAQHTHTQTNLVDQVRLFVTGYGIRVQL